VQKHIKWATSAFHPEMFILLMWGILLTGKCMLIAAHNLVLNNFFFLGGKISLVGTS
jgi:hypothetical protein